MKKYENKTTFDMGTLDGLREAYHASFSKAYGEIVNLRDALKALVLCDYDAADAAAAKTDSVFHVGLIYDHDFYIMNCANVLLDACKCINECVSIVDNTIYQLSDDCDYSYEYYYYDSCGLFAEQCVAATLHNEFDPDTADTRMLIYDDILPDIISTAEIYDVSDRINNEINYFEMQYATLSVGLCGMELVELLPSCAAFLDMCQDFCILIDEPIVDHCDGLIFAPWGLYDSILDECEHEPDIKDQSMAW